MKVALLSLSFRRYHLDKIFEVAGYFGYDGVEIWGGRPQAYPYDMDEARCAHVLELKEKYNLEVPMYTPEVLGYPYNISTPDKKEREETIDYLKKAIDVAKAIGAPRVQLACGHAGYQTNRKQNYQNVLTVMRALTEHAEKVGVDLIMEAVTLMESNTIIFLDDLVELLDDLGSSHVKTMIDTVTPMVHKEVFGDYFEKLGDKMDYIHFIDSDGVSPTHMPVGSGIIPMEALMAVLKKYGYDGWLSSELVSYASEPELSAAREIKSIRKRIEG